MAQLRFIDAITAALRQEMARDPSVYVLGEDVTLGGPFGATKGLVEAFGPARVRNTPISEGTVVGLATGAALTGLRPVVEIMFMDFLTLAMDQLVNHAAKLRYMSGGQLSVPLTIRVQGGIAGAMGAHHSQSLEAWLVHVPGLRVVAPSTPADAKGLLQSAIREDDPVIFIEHRGLYWSRGEVSEGDEATPLGRAIVRQAGDDVTILAWSRMVEVALEAASRLAAEGITAEVVDVRSLAPLDLETIVASVGHTHRALVIHEAVQMAGFGAELAVRIGEAAPEALEAPVARLGAPWIPVPFSPALERLVAPDAAAVASLAQALVAGGRAVAPATPR